MPTDHPRLNVVLEKPLYDSLSRLAKKEGVSMSLKARDLLREAMEIEEDLYWEEKAEDREKTFPRRGLAHKEVWKKTA